MSYLQKTLLAKAGQKTKARAKAMRTPRAHMTIEPIPEEGPLERVLFASPKAKEIAEQKKLTWMNFARSSHVASSEKGYTTNDVRTISKEKE